MNYTPDFNQLGRETIWPRSEWDHAWRILDEPDAWHVLIEITRTVGVQPTVAAHWLRNAMSQFGQGEHRDSTP